MANQPGDEPVTIYTAAGEPVEVTVSRSLVLLGREGYRKTPPRTEATAEKTTAKRAAKKA